MTGSDTTVNRDVVRRRLPPPLAEAASASQESRAKRTIRTFRLAGYARARGLYITAGASTRQTILTASLGEWYIRSRLRSGMPIRAAAKDIMRGLTVDFRFVPRGDARVSLR